VYQTMLELQMLDITRDPIEIAPTAHYSMGGVWVRSEDHGTGVAGRDRPAAPPLQPPSSHRRACPRAGAP
ncbi:hypothetical protein, partial [Nocardia abscessus]|uniref:hypothetical protein n=1 Tax=Nocardia abscessus TaxID=120957 RepID=UPI0024555D43